MSGASEAPHGGVRVLHSSDLHGNLDVLLGFGEPFDLWLDTGDFFPNLARAEDAVDDAREHATQLQWMRGADLAARLTSWLAGRPALTVPGNHDYLDLASTLVEAGAWAERVDVAGVSRCGLRWAGFREVKWMDGRWRGECRDFSGLIRETFASPPDVLVTHGPPAEVLESELDFGIPGLLTALRGSPRTRLHFFGHDHRRGGETTEAHGVRFFNGAKCVKRWELRATGEGVTARC